MGARPTRMGGVRKGVVLEGGDVDQARSPLYGIHTRLLFIYFSRSPAGLPMFVFLVFLIRSRKPSIETYLMTFIDDDRCYGRGVERGWRGGGNNVSDRPVCGVWIGLDWMM